MEKDAFREKLEDILASINDNEGVLVSGDLNCHLGPNNTGYEEVMGLYGYGVQNEDGIALLAICKNHRVEIANTYIRKDPEKQITYKSGGVSKQLDLILWKHGLDVSLVNYKDIPGEECLTQIDWLEQTSSLENRIRKNRKELKSFEH